MFKGITKKVIASILMAAPVLAQVATPALANDVRQPLKPMTITPKAPSRAIGARSEVLLVMPNAKADVDETMEAIGAAHGQIIGRFGDGALTTLIIKSDKEHFADTEKKLSKDGHFAAVQRDYVAVQDIVQQAGANDPYFTSEWHLGALNVVPAWQRSNGQGVTIAIADTGCQSSNLDLSGKTLQGVNLVATTQEGRLDTQSSSHGTLCATTAAANTNNGKLTSAPAYGSTVYPIVISQDGSTSDSYVATAILQAGLQGYRVLNISYGSSDARYSFANASAHPVVHTYLKWFHDQRNGLAFFAAGNSGQFDPNAKQPYLIMVSAMNQQYSLANFSNYGNSIWFTAPGTSITCSDRRGAVAAVDGTSFASPLVASIAALVISRNPGLRNTDVERILISSCSNIPGSKYNVYYGYGLPDAAKAVSLAR